MKYLNLDPQFSPFGASIAFKSFTFPGGEPHIQIEDALDDSEAVCISTRPRSFNDLGLLAVATDALRRMGIQRIELFIPYFPGARQDRLMTPGEPLTVKVYSEMINAMDFFKVYVLDPHSDVTPALLNSVEVIGNHAFVREAIPKDEELILISPDAGAQKKVQKLAQALGNTNVVECGKQRNVITGKLSGFKVYADDLKGQDCIIVDDICDGGGTFLGLAEELKKHNAGRLTLIVTHGIFSRGLTELSKSFDRIFCTDSFSTIEADALTQIKCTSKWIR